VWGTEASRESDPEMSVRTALDLQARAREYLGNHPDGLSFEDSDLARLLKIGISTGTVLVGNTRDTGEFITTGSAVNSAKRLVSDAEPGDILATHDTYQHIRGVFQVQKVRQTGRQTSGSQTHRSDIYSITAVKPRVFRTEAHGVEGSEASMVGREFELAKMLDALDTAKEIRKLQVVAIVGEAGLGKSRLLFEFYDQVDLLPDKSLVFKGRALETMRGQPYSLVKEIFRFRFDILEDDPDIAAREKFVAGMLDMATTSVGPFSRDGDGEMKAHIVGHLIGFDFSDSPHISPFLESEKQIQERAVLYASQFFASISQNSPVVFYVDDLHWADDESLNFFDSISEKCSDHAILFTFFSRMSLFERRPHWGEGRENWSRLDLGPLTKRETGRLIKDILSKAKDIPPTLQEILVSKTAGNPFYVEELIKMFIEQGSIKIAGEEWVIDPKIGELSVPPTLTGVLQSRLDRLTEIERRVLQRSSVVGREFWDNIIIDCDPGVDVPTALESLRRKELLFRKESSAFTGSAEYVFKHSLLRDVTYETTLLEERREWHRETAEWLINTKGERRNEYLSVIGEHFERAGETKKSATWYGRAGENAVRSYALETAEAHLRNAVRFWNPLLLNESTDQLAVDEVIRWNHSLGWVLHSQARFAEAIGHFTNLLEMTTKLKLVLEQAGAFWGLSVCQFEVGETRKSLNSAIEVVRLVGILEPSGESVSLTISGLYRQGRALIAMGHFEEATEIAERALKLQSEWREGDLVARANCLHLLAGTHMYLGRFAEAQVFEKEEVAISRKIGDLRTVGNGLNSLGFQSYMQGKGADAITYYHQALEIAREIGNKTGEIMILSNICGAKIILKEYESAETDLKELIVGIRDTGHFLAVEMYRFLAEALIGLGKHNKAAEAALKSLSLAQETENQEAIGEAWRVLGVVSSCRGSDISAGEKRLSASDCFDESLRIFEDRKMEANCAMALYNFAQHELAQRNTKKAEKMFGRESEISDRLKIDTPARSPYFGPGSSNHHTP
ncbi:MAG: tetratricopeptide repeat protein, partial [Pyrinomonadaceae bacterium]